MTTANEVKTRAREILAQDLPEEYRPEVSDEDDMLSEGGVDSLGLIHVLTKLEAEFGSHIPDEESWDIKTLNDLADAIVRHQGDAKD